MAVLVGNPFFIPKTNQGDCNNEDCRCMREWESRKPHREGSHRAWSGCHRHCSRREPLCRAKVHIKRPHGPCEGRPYMLRRGCRRLRRMDAGDPFPALRHSRAPLRHPRGDEDAPAGRRRRGKPLP